jgi:hypothetical protein
MDELRLKAGQAKAEHNLPGVRLKPESRYFRSPAFRSPAEPGPHVLLDL